MTKRIAHGGLKSHGGLKVHGGSKVRGRSAAQEDGPCAALARSMHDEAR